MRLALSISRSAGDIDARLRDADIIIQFDRQPLPIIGKEHGGRALKSRHQPADAAGGYRRTARR